MKKIDIFNLSKYLKRTGDNKLARIGHVNYVIGNTIPLPENPQNGDALIYNSTTGLWESGSVGGGDEWQETIVDISSAQILNMGSSPIELLPAAGVGKYYDIDKIVIEKDTFSTAYDLGTAEFLRVRNTGSGTITVIHQAVLTNNSSQTAFILKNFNTNNLDFGGTLTETNRNISVNSGYTLSTNDGTNPTLGDGTMRAIIKYKVRTFGA